MASFSRWNGTRNHETTARSRLDKNLAWTWRHCWAWLLGGAFSIGLTLFTCLQNSCKRQWDFDEIKARRCSMVDQEHGPKALCWPNNEGRGESAGGVMQGATTRHCFITAGQYGSFAWHWNRSKGLKLLLSAREESQENWPRDNYRGIYFRIFRGCEGWTPSILSFLRRSWKFSTVSFAAGSRLTQGCDNC